MNITSKLTLYDILCMMVCGYLILCLLTGSLAIHVNVLFYVLCYLAGMIYHKMMEALLPCLRNIPYLIKRANRNVAKETEQSLPVPTMENYYKAYYLLMKEGCLGNIPVLEAQVAFCKDIIPILIVVIVAVLGDCLDASYVLGYSCHLALQLSVITLALVPVWYFSQIKVHELVWHGYYFLRKMKDEKDNP